jgi:preprotein translocase subunit SecF
VLTQMPFDLSALAASETLSRTNDIPGTGVLVLLALFLFGGYVIRPFALTLIIGFASGRTLRSTSFELD